MKGCGSLGCLSGRPGLTRVIQHFQKRREFLFIVREDQFCVREEQHVTFRR
jgi:hypothetical protein